MKCSINRNSCLISKILMIAALAAILLACDNIDDPYQEEQNNETKSGNVRKILIEEFTGFKCGNCPGANKKAHELAEKFPDRIILVGIHAGGFARPEETGKYTKDYRTAAGDATFDFFDIQATPKALISRHGDDSKAIPEPNWESVLDQVLNTEPAALIKIFHEYDDDTRTLDLDIFITYLTRGSSSHRLSLYVVEDGIIDWQTDYDHDPIHIEGYTHNDVLRGAINGEWGDQLSKGDIPLGYTFRKEISYTIPDDVDWNPDNLKLIAFIHDYGETYEVLQAEEIHFKE